MGPALVIALNPVTDFFPGQAACLEGMQVYAFVFENTPQLPNHDIVHPAHFAVDGNPDDGLNQHLS